MKGKTTFVVAHRLTTIQNADKIIVMDEGKISRMGTHDQLLGQEGVYKRLWEAAKLEEAPAPQSFPLSLEGRGQGEGDKSSREETAAETAPLSVKTPPPSPSPLEGEGKIIGARRLLGSWFKSLGSRVVSVLKTPLKMYRGDEIFRLVTAKHKKGLAAYKIFLVLDGILNIVMIWLLGSLIDAAQSKALIALIVVGVNVTLLTFGYALVERTHAWFYNKTGVLVVRDIRSGLFRRAISQFTGFFRKYPPSGLATRMGNDTAMAEAKNTHVPGAIPHFLIQGLLTAVALAMIDWKFALGILLLIPPFALFTSKYAQKFEEAATQVTDKSSAMTNQAEDLLSQVEVVKTFGAEPQAVERFQKTNNEVVKAASKRAKLWANFTTLTESLSSLITNFSITIFGAWTLALLGYPTAGALLALSFYAGSVQYVLKGFSSLYQDYKEGEGATKRIQEVWNTEPGIKD
ncbi:MAG: hypothetical protein HY747_10270 [Elusimicrobia bacterium]|nr:hypothetical protein [Elusimicrobiota bacterium]